MLFSTFSCTLQYAKRRAKNISFMYFRASTNYRTAIMKCVIQIMCKRQR